MYTILQNLMTNQRTQVADSYEHPAARVTINSDFGYWFVWFCLVRVAASTNHRLTERVGVITADKKI